MENDYFQKGNIKHIQNIIDPNQELISQKHDKFYVNNPFYIKINFVYI